MEDDDADDRGLPPGREAEIVAGLPAWTASVALRLEFFGLRDLRRGANRDVAAALEAVRRAAEAGGGERVLQGFLRACLDLLVEETASRADLADGREELLALCGMARTALDGDRDDRALNERADGLRGASGALGCAASVPGRVVWLAAMAAEVPEEEGGAAAMLVNDLAAVGPDLPLRALQAAVRTPLTPAGG